jgi:hypothetical protein
MISLNLTSDLESELIGDLFGCVLDQINERPIKNGTFLELVFTNVPVNMAVESAETPLLKLDRHQKAYEIEMQICCCKFEVMVVSIATGSIWRTVRRLWMNLMLRTGAAIFQVEGSTNAWTYSTRRSGASLKDMCLQDILAVNKNCHG